MKTCDTLQDLTGQESGVVLYGTTAIICNWSTIAGLPRAFCGSIVGLPVKGIPVVKGRCVACVANCLDGCTVEDYGATPVSSDDLAGAGTVYNLGDDATVIAPDGWN